MKPLAMVVVAAALSLVPPPLPRLFAGGTAQAAETRLAEESIVGEWWTEKKDGRVRFVKQSDGTYRGIVTWGARPQKDRFNKNKKLRDRAIVGIVVMWHLVYSDGEYDDGYVYNPEDGGTYRVKAWMTGSGSLKLRGYAGISLLGQTQTWTRYR